MKKSHKKYIFGSVLVVFGVASGIKVIQQIIRKTQVDKMTIDLKGNESLFNAKELNLIKKLQDDGQGHLAENWDPKGTNDDKKKDMIKQIEFLDAKYPGGLFQYIKNARQLLKDSKEGKNPLEGYKPEVPKGKIFDFGSEDFLNFQEKGLAEAGKSAFVIVAGGLGERLGYVGIKLAIPVELTRGESYMQFYFEHIIAIQIRNKNQIKLPVLLMTSDDTHQKTLDLLEKESYFGLDKDQVHILKQEKVACLGDNDASLSADPKDKYQLLTKPHGHGDVHSLLYSSGLLQKWQKMGITWVNFLQDTNGLVFTSLLPALAQSAQEGYDMNSCAVPRKGKEQVGAIVTLIHDSGSQITCNVEYNQLDPLLRSTGHPDGDVNDDSGFSPYPGNINQLILKLDSYIKTLHETKGAIVEFVNPKYKDESKTTFKSPTRLECMMQDYAKSLGKGTKAGFTVVKQVWATFSPVKNNPEEAAKKSAKGDPTHSATAGEFDTYNFRDQQLKMVGVKLPSFQKQEFNGITVEVGPKVTWTPDFAMLNNDLKIKFPHPENIQLDKDAVLIIEGGSVVVNSLQLTGTLIIKAIHGAQVEIDGLKVQNKGWSWDKTEGDKQVQYTQEEAIKGFKINKRESQFLKFDAPGKYKVNEEGKISETDLIPALQKM